MLMAMQSAVTISHGEQESKVIEGVTNAVAKKSGLASAYFVEDVGRLASFISGEYRVPICSERVLFEPGSTRDVAIKSAIKYFCLQEGQQLSSALDEFVKSSQGLYSCRIINQSICIGPVPQNTPEFQNVLDMRISYRSYGGSTWDALKEIARAVNQTYVDDGVASALNLTYAGYSHAVKPPDAFTEEIIPNNSLVNVSVREALRTVFELSPLQLSYSFLHSKPAGMHYLYIRIYIDGEGMSRFKQPNLTLEEQSEWRTEIDQDTGYAAARKHMYELNRQK
jgi:hypothetical protein